MDPIRVVCIKKVSKLERTLVASFRKNFAINIKSIKILSYRLIVFTGIFEEGYISNVLFQYFDSVYIIFKSSFT